MSHKNFVIHVPHNLLIIHPMCRFIIQEQNTLESWNATAWAKKVDKKAKRASLTDFDRFKVMIAKKQKSKLVADKLATL